MPAAISHISNAVLGSVPSSAEISMLSSIGGEKENTVYSKYSPVA